MLSQASVHAPEPATTPPEQLLVYADASAPPLAIGGQHELLHEGPSEKLHAPRLHANRTEGPVEQLGQTISHTDPGGYTVPSVQLDVKLSISAYDRPVQGNSLQTCPALQAGGLSASYKHAMDDPLSAYPALHTKSQDAAPQTVPLTHVPSPPFTGATSAGHTISTHVCKALHSGGPLLSKVHVIAGPLNT